MMKFTEADLDRLATSKILKHYTKPVPSDERLHHTLVEYYPEGSYLNLRGYGRYNRMSHVTMDMAMAHVHSDYKDDALKHIAVLNACTEDSYQFYVVMCPWNNRYDYRVMVVSLFADYDDAGRIVRYTGCSTDATNEVYDRRINMKFKQRSIYIEEKFRSALWSIDPDEMMLYCDKVGQDDFYHDYNAYEFIKLVHPDYQQTARNMMWAMHARNYDMSDLMVCVRYPDNSEHYLQCKVEKLLDEQGDIFRYLIFSYDATEQKHQEFKNKTFHEHLHKMMVEAGIHLFYYTPGSEKLHMEDPLADPRLINIDIDVYIERVFEDDRFLFKDVFDHCDKRDLARQEFSYRLMPFNDDTYHRYRNIVLPVFNEKGDLLMYGFIRMDITNDYNNQATFSFAQTVGNIGAWTHDLVNDKIEWTEGMCRIFGTTNRDFTLSLEGIASRIVDQETDYVSNFVNLVNNSDENDHVFNFKIRAFTDEVKYVELRVHLDRNKDHTPLFAYGTMMDVTDRSLLALEKEKSDTLLHTLLRHYPSMVFVKDIQDDFRIVAANDAYAQYFEKPLEDVIGKGLSEYSMTDDTEAYMKSDREAASYTADHPLIEFISHVNDKGERRFYQKSKFGQTVSGRKLLICTATDVTELHRAKEKAEQSDRLKSAFLANMSHEIRTPLNAIVGFCDLIVNNINPEENKQFVKIIHNNSDNLLRLIGDILDISKLEARSMKFSFVDFSLDGMLYECYMGMKEQFEEKGVHLELVRSDDSCMIHQDRVRVAEIVNNFLTNAFKHTNTGTVKIEYGCKKERFKISVSDTGTGIAKEKLHAIFNRFEKLDEFKEGTGLGLAICKGLTKALGGKIGVNSELGKGSTFWVVLPKKAIER